MIASSNRKFVDDQTNKKSKQVYEGDINESEPYMQEGYGLGGSRGGEPDPYDLNYEFPQSPGSMVYH